jgi:Holliday junction resolvasome RuvABC endonuclease subunit
MNPTILALDLGTTTGWACQAADGTIIHGWASFKTGRYEGGGMRYLRFKKWLGEIYGSVGPEISAIYFEEVRRHVSTDSAHVYGGLMATLTSWAEANNIPYQGVSVGTIKKHVTGRGNASKQDMVEAMQLLGHPITDDNEADALSLLHWALDQP